MLKTVALPLEIMQQLIFKTSRSFKAPEAGRTRKRTKNFKKPEYFFDYDCITKT